MLSFLAVAVASVVASLVGAATLEIGPNFALFLNSFLNMLGVLLLIVLKKDAEDARQAASLARQTSEDVLQTVNPGQSALRHRERGD